MLNADLNPQSAPLWKVGVPRQTQIVDPQRGFTPGWEVPIIMADKSTFVVTIPADQFTPEHVNEVIQEHVDRVVAIRALEGPTY